MEDKIDLRGTYCRWVQQPKSSRPNAEAMKIAIGGQFEAYGQIEADMLRFFGLVDRLL